MWPFARLAIPGNIDIVSFVQFIVFTNWRSIRLSFTFFIVSIVAICCFDREKQKLLFSDKQYAPHNISTSTNSIRSKVRMPHHFDYNNILMTESPKNGSKCEERGKSNVFFLAAAIEFLINKSIY